jgi:hypothetical protein
LIVATRPLPRNSARQAALNSERRSMPISKASVPTANGAKYMQQLCKHWSHKLEVDFSEQEGVVKFPAAVATFDARADALQVTIEGEESEAVERMKGAVSLASRPVRVPRSAATVRLAGRLRSRISPGGDLRLKRRRTT